MKTREETVYYQSDSVTVARSCIVIQPYSGSAWRDWLLGHPGERTLAMQAVSSIMVTEPSKVRPLIVMAIGLPLSLVGGIGIPILIAGAIWLWYLLKFGKMVRILTPAGAVEVYGADAALDRIIEAVRNALANRGQVNARPAGQAAPGTHAA